MTGIPRIRWFAIVAAALVLGGASQPAGPRQPNDTDRCPVCGMLVTPHADWLAQLVPGEDEALFFDGPKDLFSFLVGTGFAEARAAIGESPEIFVTSYYEREAIDARAALYVVGSDVLGPMGAELVPHRTRDDAEEFARDHGGSAIVTFDAVSPELLAGLH